MKIPSIGKFAISIFVCQLAGYIGSLFTTPALRSWYVQLNKPALVPPDYVFGIVWTILFLLMGIALYLVWQKGGQQGSKKARHQDLKIAFQIFTVQIVLNILWSVLFFGLNDTLAAFFGVISLWFAILTTMIVFFRISRLAGWLLVPYLAWVTFASYLNYGFIMLN